MAAADLFDLAKEYLDACVAALSEPIVRAYVSPGTPAWDCEQLTVHVGGASEGHTAPVSPPLQIGQRAATSVVNLASLTATVLRCVPMLDSAGNPPAAADMQTAAALDAQDLWEILNHLRREKRAGNLFASDDGQREMMIDPLVSVHTTGGLAGWEIPIRVQLDGF